VSATAEWPTYVVQEQLPIGDTDTDVTLCCPLCGTLREVSEYLLLTRHGDRMACTGCGVVGVIPRL